MISMSWSTTSFPWRTFYSEDTVLASRTENHLENLCKIGGALDVGDAGLVGSSIRSTMGRISSKSWWAWTCGHRRVGLEVVVERELAKMA